MDELTADVFAIVKEEHDFAAPGGGVGGGEACGPGADDQHVAARIDLRIVGRRPVVRVDDSEAGKRADRPLERLPSRPEEGLVVEARRHEAGEFVDQRGAIVSGGRQGVDRAHGEIVLERFGGGAQVRRRASRTRHVDDRVRLLGPGPPDSPRPVIFEAPADDADAVREQRGGDAVALQPEKGFSVEGEGEGLAAIDGAAFREAERRHGAALKGSLPMTAWVAVSRVMAKDSMQVRCSHISRLAPFGLALK